MNKCNYSIVVIIQTYRFLGGSFSFCFDFRFDCFTGTVGAVVGVGSGAGTGAGGGGGGRAGDASRLLHELPLSEDDELDESSDSFPLRTISGFFDL